MRKDHRPALLQKWQYQYNQWYTERFIRPQFARLGKALLVHKPRHLQLFGSGLQAGDFLHIATRRDKPVQLTTWSDKHRRGIIKLGDYCLLAPGVEITAANYIEIGDNCMIAEQCLISDSDWHGIYNRVRPFRCDAPVIIEDNVWLGARTIVTKGVRIGSNSVIGAGSVVAANIPPNAVAAGNPARVVKWLNPKRRMLKRQWLFEEREDFWLNQSELNRFFSADNSWRYWLKTLLAPGPRD